MVEKFSIIRKFLRKPQKFLQNGKQNFSKVKKIIGIQKTFLKTGVTETAKVILQKSGKFLH
ncbi:hypothetical protein NL436_27855, partial [Klebsiella pneumoniae]|nr:hypothetical protein [Klebsiella pneumoniae]